MFAACNVNGVPQACLYANTHDAKDPQNELCRAAHRLVRLRVLSLFWLAVRCSAPAARTQSDRIERKIMSKKDLYIAKMNLQIAELNETMHDLEAKAKDARDDAREKYKEEMNKLREQSKLAGQKLETLKTTAEDGWDGMVEEMEKVRDAFTSSFHYFKSQMK